MPEAAPRHRRFVQHPQLMPEYGIPWSRMHCDRLEKDGKFPRKVCLGGNTVGYWSDEIEDWLAQRDAAGDKIDHTERLKKAWAGLANKRRKAKRAEAAA